MTAPDSRDSVERARQHIELVEMMRGPDRTGWGIAERLLDELLSTRLQALARGPQQAGGEDVPEKVVAWMNEREAWRSPRAPSEPGTHALVLADDYAALQAEVARLQKVVAGELSIEELHMVNGRIDARLTTDMAKIMAQGYLDLCDEHGAQNYLQLHMADSQGREVYVTVQRGGHPTPHDLRMKAEAALREAGRDAERGREIAAAFLPVMEAMRPLVLNLERLKDAALNGGQDDNA